MEKLKFYKRLFKFRQFSWKWFTFYLFPRDRYDLSIGLDISDGEYPLFFFSLIFCSFDITFAPNSYFQPFNKQDAMKELKKLVDEGKVNPQVYDLEKEVYDDSYEARQDEAFGSIMHQLDKKGFKDGN